jgi:hypothetical protein
LDFYFFSIFLAFQKVFIISKKKKVFPQKKISRRGKKMASTYTSNNNNTNNIANNNNNNDNNNEMPPSLYFSDDEHFNKKLQNGVSATTLFDDAMNHHKHQQHEYMYQQKRQQQQKQEKASANNNIDNFGTSPNSRRQSSVGSPLSNNVGTSTGRGANSFLQQGAYTATTTTSNSINNSRTGTATNSNKREDLGVMTSTSHLSDFPNISMDDPLYSSTITMLKRTRGEITQLASELSAANMINELPTSEDVRRIVAKIFADPRNAEAISESEWRRMEQGYLTQREKLSEKINDHLQQEKAALQEEIKRLGMDS